MKNIVLAAVAALMSTSAMAYTVPAEMGGDGLYVLATTGSGDKLVEEGRGMISVHGPEGDPFFVQNMDAEWVQKARTLLNEGEFLAPHYFKGWDGTYYVMVAPHLVNDMGEIEKGAGPDDSFIRVKPYKEIVLPNGSSVTKDMLTVEGIITSEAYDPFIDLLPGSFSNLEVGKTSISYDVNHTEGDTSINGTISGEGDVSKNGDITIITGSITAEWTTEVKDSGPGNVHIHPEEVDRWDYSEDIAS